MKDIKKETIINTGFIQPFIGPEEWVGGSNSQIPDEILRPDGDWSMYYLDNEKQAGLSFDPADCTCNGSINQIQAYIKEKFGIDEQYSKRALAIVAGVHPPGANPQDVYEAIRLYGLVPESEFPFDPTKITTLEQFLNPAPYSIEQLKLMGMKWLSRFSFRHEWGFYPMATLDYKKQVLAKSFKSCPPAYSVVGWQERNGKYYKAVGQIDNHWVTGEKDAPDGWETKDSYDPFDKMLEKDYDFGFLKRIYITQHPPILKKKSIWQQIVEFIKNFKYNASK